MKSFWVVCVVSEWFKGYELFNGPKKDELYLVVGVVQVEGQTYYALKGFCDLLFNSLGFRPVDMTFGENIVKEIEPDYAHSD